MLATVNWLVGWWKNHDDLASRLYEQAHVLLAGCLSPATKDQQNPKRLR